jgi:riboflavin biosynthesis protein ribF
MVKIMKIYENFEVEKKYKRSITIGDFDGLHNGHMPLIKKTIETAKNKGYVSCALTFRFNTANLSNNKVKYLCDIDEKIELFKKSGIDELFIIEFCNEIKNTNVYDFISKILVDKLNVKYLLLGDDAKLGSDRLDIHGIEEVCKICKVDFFSLSQVQIDNIRVTSSHIRSLIANGVVDENLTKFLGRDYCFSGEVVHGNGLGVKLGFPTANIMLNSSLVLPKFGVYYAVCEIDGKRYDSAINIGDKPTVDNNYLGLEAFIFDFNEDIYGKKIKIYLKKFIRKEEKFKNLDELINQMKKDVEDIRKLMKIAI